tara:strand:- start:3635 stop:4036 length:402 start_codon:yes stop_codon:yes gene_type:complete
MAGVGFTSSTPIFCVKDLALSLVHYRDVLGFRIPWQWSEAQAFDENAAPTFASVGRGEIEIFLCQQEQGQPGAWLFLRLASLGDLAAIQAEFEASGAKILEPPTDRPWGMREMHVADPDGNTLRIGAPLGTPC